MPMLTGSIGSGGMPIYVCAHIDEIGAIDNASGVGVAIEALRIMQELQEDWQHLGCLGQEQRILLHYLSGKIHVEVFYPNSCYEDAQTVETMRESMLQAVKDRCYFEDVTLYFG